MKQQYVYVAIVVVLIAACVYLFTQNRDLRTKAAKYEALAEDAAERAKQHQSDADAYRAESEALAADLENQKQKTTEIQKKYEDIKGRYDRYDSEQLQRELASKLN